MDLATPRVLYHHFTLVYVIFIFVIIIFVDYCAFVYMPTNLNEMLL